MTSGTIRPNFSARTMTTHTRLGDLYLLGPSVLILNRTSWRVKSGRTRAYISELQGGRMTTPHEYVRGYCRPYVHCVPSPPGKTSSLKGRGHDDHSDGPTTKGSLRYTYIYRRDESICIDLTGPDTPSL